MPRPSRSRPPIALLAAGLALLALALWWAVPRSTQQTTLAGGGILRCAGIGVGTQLVFSVGSPLGEFAGRAGLPNRWLPGRFRVATFTVIARDEPVLAMALIVRHPNRPAPTLAFSLADATSTNNPFLPLESIRPTPIPGRPQESYYCLRAPAWPRQAPRFLIRIHESPAPSTEPPSPLPPDTLILPNPQPATRETWTPNPIPAAVPLAESTVHLERFEVRPMPRPLGVLPGPDGREPRGFLEFRLSASPTPPLSNVLPAPGSALPTAPSPPGAGRWTLFETLLRDPVGNARMWINHSSRPEFSRPIGDTVALSSLPLPWPHETVFRIETAWLPPPPSQFQSYDPTTPNQARDELVQIPHVALGPAIRPPGLVGRFLHSSGLIELHAGRGRHAPEPGWILRVNARPLPPPPPPGVTTSHGLRLADHALKIVGAEDTQGRRWTPRQEDELEIPEATAALTVTVAVRRLLHANFLAAPERTETSLPRPKTPVRTPARTGH